MIPRLIEAQLRNHAGRFPAVSSTGPRQRGKSMLVRAVFLDYTYLNLEDPQLRREIPSSPLTKTSYSAAADPRPASAQPLHEEVGHSKRSGSHSRS